ncbi:hypothetical protein VIGAN_01185800 [Vigna angularis var. angularis]|uniref:Uncharacterized protein n=1 Tax=Vigna angularis var. angularis TaxID=157739 RepID=A0A0S3R0W8_PHAAN|nr:hypothetical protein VIGAN_01185800 [Vigna angularis var. angularis]
MFWTRKDQFEANTRWAPLGSHPMLQLQSVVKLSRLNHTFVGLSATSPFTSSAQWLKIALNGGLTKSSFYVLIDGAQRC